MAINRQAHFGNQDDLNYLLNEIFIIGKYEFKCLNTSMDFKQFRVEGKVQKAIENENFFHVNSVHYRSLVLDFGKQPKMVLLHRPFTEDAKQKKFLLHQINSVSSYQDEELRTRNR